MSITAPRLWQGISDAGVLMEAKPRVSRVYCPVVEDSLANSGCHTGCTDADWEEIRATTGGNGDAYQRLVSRYQRSIGRYLWRFARNPADWEVLVQDVFVQAYFSLSSFRGSGPFEAWLKRIATRVGYRYWKQQARQRMHQPMEYADDQALPANEDTPLVAEEAARILHDVLATLPPRDRLVLTLQYFEALDTQAIARRTGWSRAMVKVQAHRARAKLGKRLKALGVNL